MKRLAASRTNKVIQNDLMRNGFGRCGSGPLAAFDGVAARVGAGPPDAAINGWNPMCADGLVSTLPPPQPYAPWIRASTQGGYVVEVTHRVGRPALPICNRALAADTGTLSKSST